MRFPNGKTNIAFTGVSDNAFRDADAEAVVSGKTLASDTIAAAVDAALQGVTILSDHYASEDYRRHLAKVYLKKALVAVSGL
jgi:carbon-monoxide dehydrogenase medium subunit